MSQDFNSPLLNSDDWLSKFLPTSLKTFRCVAGHVLRSESPLSISTYDSRGSIIAQAIICPICYVNWIRANVPGMTEVS